MSPMPNITTSMREEVARDRNKERLQRATQVLQSFASGFTLRPITVRLARGGKAPAFSTSDRIWFDLDMMADLTTPEGVATLKGLTFHEMCHILLTPRDGSAIRQWVMDNNVRTAWNMLEDQRIESTLIAMYPSIQPWFEAMIAEYMLKNPQQWNLQFPLIRGRKYLDARIRRIVRDLYIKQDDVKELSDIIDEYRLLDLTDEADIERSKALVLRYAELIKGNEQADPNGHEHRGEHEHETNVKSKPMSKSQQKNARERLKEFEYEDEDDVDIFPPDEDDVTDEPTDGYEEDTDEDYDFDDDEDEDGDYDGEDGFDGADGQETERPSEPLNKDNGKKGGTGSPLEDLLRDIVQENLDETLERLGDKIAEDIALYNGEAFLEGEEVPAPPMNHMREDAPSADAYEASEAFGKELISLRADNEPAWHDRVDSGRVNPFRWEQGCELEEAFDRFEDGRYDTTDIECVILLDLSGSMQGSSKSAHESMWAIKNALDAINATTTVVGYSDSYSWGTSNTSQLIYGGNEKVGANMRVSDTGGGTNPLQALQYAKYLLSESKRAIKLLIAITDGEWNSNATEASDEIIHDLRHAGVLTSLAWLCPYDADINHVNAHGCEVVAHVRKASDLFHLGRSIVEVGIHRQLAR